MNHNTANIRNELSKIHFVFFFKDIYFKTSFKKKKKTHDKT